MQYGPVIRRVLAISVLLGPPLEAQAWMDSLAVWDKPQPVPLHSMTCPATGSGIAHLDNGTDLRKNRIDTATAYHSLPIDAILVLPWEGIAKRRYDWTPSDLATVTPYEGVPIALEGFLAGAKEEGKEATNCEFDTPPWHDWHLWLVQTAAEVKNADRTGAIVVEVTPRVRARHPAWTWEAIVALQASGARVRISGWLMFDPDHPDHVGRTRGTIWEIHPVTRIEVEQHGTWETLDEPP